MTSFILLTLSILFNTFAQISIKLASQTLPNSLKSSGTIIQILRNGNLSLAILFYLGTLITWSFVLKNIPLSKAYPFMGIVFITVPIFSKLILGEFISLKTYIGSAIIATGVSIAIS